jgi:hypothetical protein
MIGYRRPTPYPGRGGVIGGAGDEVDVLAQFNPQGQAMRWIIIVGIMLLAGCADRPLYYPQSGKAQEDFDRDFERCGVQARMVSFEHNALTSGSLRDDCMRERGWRRAN